MEKKAEEDRRPFVILLDIDMPIMSGWDFLDFLKNRIPYFLNRMNIYILTGYDIPDYLLKINNYF